MRRLALAVFLIAAACARSEKKDVYAHAPVILISIDTLRADHLPAYGYRGVATPAFDVFRRDSILFENAYSHVPMTLPSHVSLLTGLLPTQNGVRNNLGYAYDEKAHPAVSNILAQHGYATGAAVSAYVIRGATGLSAAFQTYDDVVPARSNVSIGELSRKGRDTVAVAQQWIGAHERQPFFYFLHLFEPHTPYEPIEPFKSRYASAYDGEIATADSYLGGFIEWLKQQSIYDDALIIVLSDHGEGLGDHGEQEHGVLLYREAIHVPLMVKLPHQRNRGLAVTEPVQLIDVAPTILHAVGINVPEAMTGTSLMGKLAEDRLIYSETYFPRIHLGWSELRSLIGDRYHYVEAPRPELYDDVADRGEKKNVLEDQRRVYAAMREAMQPYRASAAQPSNVDPEEAARLAALGYIGNVRSGSSGPLPDPKDHIAELERMKEGGRLEEQGDVAGALTIYESLVAANPRFTDAWIKIAIVNEKMANVQKAIASYKRAVDVAPELAPGLAISIANLQLQAGDLVDAEGHAKLALTRSPGAAHLVLARIALARHDSMTAESEARSAMADATRSRDAAVVLAQVLAAAGRLPEALDTVTRASAEGRDPVENLQLTRGDILARMQRSAEAEQAFQLELQQFPHNLDAYSKYALLLVTEGRPNDARTLLAAMLRANPGPAAQRVAAGTRKFLNL